MKHMHKKYNRENTKQNKTQAVYEANKVLYIKLKHNTG